MDEMRAGTAVHQLVRAFADPFAKHDPQARMSQALNKEVGAARC
jgi:hypothetical protein